MAIQPGRSIEVGGIMAHPTLPKGGLAEGDRFYLKKLIIY